MAQTHTTSRRGVWWLLAVISTAIVLWLALKDWQALYSKSHVITDKPMPQVSWGEASPWNPPDVLLHHVDDSMATPPWVLRLRSPLSPSEQRTLFEELKQAGEPVWMRSTASDASGWETEIVLGPWLHEEEADQARMRLLKQKKIAFETLRYDDQLKKAEEER